MNGISAPVPSTVWGHREKTASARHICLHWFSLDAHLPELGERNVVLKPHSGWYFRSAA